MDQRADFSPLGTGQDKEFRVVRPEAGDWQVFLLEAAREGWRVPAGEIALWRGPLADSALALRHRDRFVGLVTRICYGSSAWIGNLLVVPDWRGRGCGARLLDQAILELHAKQVCSVWLTASDAGAPLYQRRGFTTLGTVERWVRPPAKNPGGKNRQTMAAGLKSAGDLRAEDVGVWGERRCLLDFLLSRGQLLQSGTHLALLQQDAGLQILGPWFAPQFCTEDVCSILSQAASFPSTDELVIDVRTGVLSPCVLKKAGFLCRGRTRLMIRGDTRRIDLNPLVSFASLGSMG